MANSYQVIDESTWKRAMHCMVFRNSVEPAFCVTFEADITNFLNKVKKRSRHILLARLGMMCSSVPRCRGFLIRTYPIRILGIKRMLPHYLTGENILSGAAEP